MAKKEVVEVLDKVPASELQNILNFVHVLKRQRGGGSRRIGSVSSLPMSLFVDAGLSFNQIVWIVEVLQKLHKKVYGETDFSKGLSQTLPMLRVIVKDNEEIVTGLFGVSVDDLGKEISKRLSRKEKKISDKKNQTIKISVHGGTLFIHERSGLVKLNDIGDKINPIGKEFKIILTLAKNDDHQATYVELIGEEDTETRRRTLGFSIRNLKETLGILPRKMAKNKDIIKNIKKFGYKLLS